MAFATSLPRTGTDGDALTRTGKWTASVADAAGTIAVRGKVLGREFLMNVSSGPSERVRTSLSNSSGTDTITIYHHGAVTDGSYVIRYI